MFPVLHLRIADLFVGLIDLLLRFCALMVLFGGFVVCWDLGFGLQCDFGIYWLSALCFRLGLRVLYLFDC